MYVYLTINHTQQAILYTLSWRLVSAPATSHHQATNNISKNGKPFTLLVSGLMMARVF
jgi:hypothetical protein